MTERYWLSAALLSMHTDPAGPLGGDVTGGMNVYVREIARALPSLGVRADVFTRATGGPRPGDESPEIAELSPGARLIRIPAGPRKPLDKNHQTPLTGEFASGIRRFADEQGERYGLISSHYWLSALAGQELAGAWGVPLVHRFHTIAARKNGSLPGDGGKESGGRMIAEEGIARRADALVASSEAEADDLAGMLGSERGKIDVIPCGVDSERFSPLPRARAKKMLGLGERERVILSVSRIEPIKGLDRLVRALEAIREMRPDISVSVIHAGGEAGREPQAGSGQTANGLVPGDFNSPAQRGEVARILGLAGEANLAGSFRFHGARSQEELRAYYSAADVLAIPSRYETFGLVALEAAACGLPAVAFDVGGLSGAIETGGSGHLVPEGDIMAFAGAALNIITSPETRARLAARARERARDFSWRSAAERETEVWRKLLRLRAGEPDKKDSPRRVSPVSG